MTSNNNRFYQYGDGIFTTLLKFNGRFLTFAAHYQRLVLGCHFLGIKNPFYSKDEFYHFLQREVTESTVIIKVIISAINTDRLYHRKNSDSSVLIETRPFEFPISDLQTNGISLSVSDIDYHPPYNEVSFLKLPHYQPWSVIRNHNSAGFDTIVRSEDEILEATCGSLFLLNGNKVTINFGFSKVLHSITLLKFIDALSEFGLILDRRKITVFNLLDSESLFYCNSVYGLLPVREVTFGNQKSSFSLNSAVCRTFWDFYTTRD